MTERIDHTATAMAMIDGIGQLSSPAQVERAIAMAQVHATLALVEQQRIVNLITLGYLFVQGEHIVSAHDGNLALDARKALGL